jgi:hypothetical protein
MMLTQRRARLKSLPLLSPLLQPEATPSVRLANANFDVLTHRATFEWGTHPSAIGRSAKSANVRFSQHDGRQRVDFGRPRSAYSVEKLP